MILQCGSGSHRTDFCIKTVFDRLGFARVGNDAENFFGFQNLADGHGYGLTRNVFERSEPPLVKLLAAARFVERHYGVRLLGVKISGRIVESEMTIFPDARQKLYQWGLAAIRSPTVFMTALRIIRAAEQMIFPDADFVDKALAQIFAEAGRVRFGKAHVFIEVEHFDAAPIDVRCSSQRFKKFELGCSGSGDDASLATRSDRFPDDCCGASGGGSRQRLFVGKFSEDHGTLISLRRCDEECVMTLTIHDSANRLIVESASAANMSGDS